jgi:uncharacterized protein YciU (UPF0263 family)
MENKTNAMQDFKEFASDRLKNHLDELNVRYENRKIDKNTLEKAYDNHREIFSQELDEKIIKLSSGQDNQWLQAELQNQKDSYLNQLSLKSN